MSYWNKAKDLYDMLDKGQAMEALEKHYSSDVSIQEMPTGQTRSGKQEQKEAIQKWFEMVKEHHGSGTYNIASNEENGTTMVESWTEITMQNGHRMKMEQVAVQKWNAEGQIEKEQFYYQLGPPPASH